MKPIAEQLSEDEVSIEESQHLNPPTQLPKKPSMLQSEFDRLIANSRSYFSDMAFKFAEVATNIMSTSKGRNKLCSLIQYQAKLIYTCTINSNIPEVQNMVM